MKLSQRVLNILAVVGFLATVMGIVVTIYLGVKALPQKTAEWHLKTQGDLVSINQSVQNEGKLEILFNDEPTDNIQFVVLTFVNSGTSPIIASDFATPLSLQFDKNAKIFSATVTQIQPSALQIDASINGSEVNFAPTLFNSGDNFSVQIIGSNLRKSVIVQGRIAGVSDIRLLEDSNLPTNPANAIANVLTGIAFGLLAIGTYEVLPRIAGKIFKNVSPRSVGK